MTTALRRLPLAILLGLPASLNAQTTAPATRPTLADPFSAMEQLYRPLTLDETGWALKVEAISDSPGAFAHGTRELFYLWARDACADWARDASSTTWCHGDVHLGNEGTYVSDIPTAQLSLGLTDFDEAYVGPFQMDLLCTVVSLRLDAARQGLDDTPGRAAKIARDVVAAYRKALTSGRTATEEYRDDPRVRDLLVAGRKTLRDEAAKHATAGKYDHVVRKKGELKEVYDPFRDGVAVTSLALSDAAERTPSLGRLLAANGADGWATLIEDAVLRRHIGSAGSQGMMKVVARVRSGVRLADGTTDAAIYLKAEGPAAAAQRAGFAPLTFRASGKPAEGAERVAAAMATLCSPAPDGVGPCEVGGVSFLLEVRTPWGSAVNPALTTPDDLEWASTYLGCLVGAAHASAAKTPARAAELSAKTTPDLEQLISARATAFIQANAKSFETWDHDPRVIAQRKRAHDYLASLDRK